MKKYLFFLVILLGVGAFLIESLLIKDVFSRPTLGANRSGKSEREVPEAKKRHPDDPYVIHREASDDVDPELYSSVSLKAGDALTGITPNLGHQVSASANVCTKNYGQFSANYNFFGSYGVSATIYHDWVPSDESSDMKSNTWRGWLGVYASVNDVDWFDYYDPQETIADCAAGASARGAMYNSGGPTKYYHTWSYW